MPDESRIAELIFKELIGDLSFEEKVELDAWRNEDPAHQRFMEEYMDRERVIKDLHLLMKYDTSAPWEKFSERFVNLQSPPAKRRTFLLPRWTMAAAACLVALLSIWLLYTQQHKNNLYPLPVGEAMVKPGIHPCLILREGDTIRLDEMTNGATRQEDGWTITKTARNAIEVHASGDATSRNPSASKYHILTVPYGQTWRITLPDGSDVQVAPGSTLAYIVSPFPRRLVSLHGEAFFNIAPNSDHPFAVVTKMGEVDALGTSFDLMDAENKFQAALVSGAICVRYHGKSNVLKPGEEVKVDREHKDIGNVQPANLKEALAWRDPTFMVTGRSLGQVMQQVGEWYGKKIRYEANVDTTKHKLMGIGSLQKDIPLEVVLEMIKPRGITFRIKGDTLIIGQNN
jgi:ferric-dicitrate binding protein FerR (iron transport regulator)